MKYKDLYSAEFLAHFGPKQDQVAGLAFIGPHRVDLAPILDVLGYSVQLTDLPIKTALAQNNKVLALNQRYSDNEQAEALAKAIYLILNPSISSEDFVLELLLPNENHLLHSLENAFYFGPQPTDTRDSFRWGLIYQKMSQDFGVASPLIRSRLKQLNISCH